MPNAFRFSFKWLLKRSVTMRNIRDTWFCCSGNCGRRVERYINQKDRRQIVLKLTPSGETFIHEVWPQIARQSGQAWEDFTKEDYDTLQHLLGKLLNRLGN